MRDMVDDQIIRRGVRDKLVIEAMRTVDRAIFVPQEDISRAYEDYPLPIGFGQTISQPYIVAYMLEELHLQPTMKALEIGTGSGYQAALLAHIVQEVYTIETIPELALKAGTLLKFNGYDNVTVIEGDGFAGYPPGSPYDAIIVSAAAPVVPVPLIEQLADGGSMIIPIGPIYGTQYLYLLTRDGDEITRTPLIGVRFVPFVSKKF